MWLHVFILLIFPISAWAMPDDDFASSIDYPSVWQCDRSKFLWYCEIDPEELQEQQIRLETPQETAIRKLEELQKELKGRRALAIVEPTPENIASYIDLQNQSMQMASVFSDVWRRVIWQTPELNYELKHPVNNAALDIHKKTTRVAQVDTLERIRNDWGIFFFFKSDCPYCHMMAQTLHYIGQAHGITIFPVSLDGSALPQYPNARMDNGLATQIGVTEVPLMVLGNVHDKRLVPLGSGVISSQELIERIHVLTSTRPGESY